MKPRVKYGYVIIWRNYVEAMWPESKDNISNFWQSILDNTISPEEVELTRYQSEDQPRSDAADAAECVARLRKAGVLTIPKGEE
jgi:hypothetical protein